jgi:hypothetical protein
MAAPIVISDIDAGWKSTPDHRESATVSESAAAEAMAKALARLTQAVETLEAAADQLVRRLEASPGRTLEETRADLDALRELHVSVSRQLDMAIARLRVLVDSE